MEFKRVLRGYDPKAVDKYINDITDENKQIHSSQRERIVELLDENAVLRDRIVELQAKENAVSDALVVSRNAAMLMERQAKDYSDKVLFQAKKFYATWQAYAQTIVASLTDDELSAFNGIQRKIERIIAEYEKKSLSAAAPADKEQTAENSDDMTQSANNPTEQSDAAQAAAAQAAEKPNAEQPQSKLVNPIEKVEQAAEYVIDLRELTRADASLEELCSDLGLINSKK